MNESRKVELEGKAEKHLNKTLTYKEIVGGQEADVEYTFIATSFTSQREGDGNTVYEGFASLKKSNGKLVKFPLTKVLDYFESGK